MGLKYNELADLEEPEEPRLTRGVFAGLVIEAMILIVIFLLGFAASAVFE